MHLINEQYRILDVFEKNPFQSLMLGSAIENPDDIVVINEVVWSPLFTRELAQSLFNGFINLKTHAEDEISCQLVTAYHKGMPISNYLSSRSLPFRNRINLCYEFLKAVAAYTEFPSWIQDILIDEDQIIVWNDELLYNELLILKTSEAEYQGQIPFSMIQKRIGKIFGKMIGNSQEASPALLSFLERLKNNAPELGSLQSIFEDFQKVYLYDYYLDRDDSVLTAPAVLPIPVPLSNEPESAAEAEDTPEALASASPDEEPAVNAETPDEPSEAEESPPAAPIQEAEAVDSDMEKNLELFFSRNSRQSAASENDGGKSDQNRKPLWIIIGAVLLLSLLWFVVHAFLPGAKPVASFTGTQDGEVWHLQNQSSFFGKTTCKRSEWTVFQNGELIDLYDTYDLTLSLEEDGVYQVVLRVMDSEGRWSSPFKKALEHRQTASLPEGNDAAGTAEPTVPGTEGMELFKLKYSPERAVKDTVFYRSGSYSLQVIPGSKPAIIEIENILLKENGMVSLWISSENTQAVTLTFTGFMKNSKVFAKEIRHEPLTAIQWEMLQFTVGADQGVDRMTISVKSDSLIHLDDLAIESYK